MRLQPQTGNIGFGRLESPCFLSLWLPLSFLNRSVSRRIRGKPCGRCDAADLGWNCRVSSLEVVGFQASIQGEKRRDGKVGTARQKMVPESPAGWIHQTQRRT